MFKLSKGYWSRKVVCYRSVGPFIYPSIHLLIGLRPHLSLMPQIPLTNHLSGWPSFFLLTMKEIGPSPLVENPLRLNQLQLSFTSKGTGPNYAVTWRYLNANIEITTKSFKFKAQYVACHISGAPLYIVSSIIKSVTLEPDKLTI